VKFPRGKGIHMGKYMGNGKKWGKGWENGVGIVKVEKIRCDDYSNSFRTDFVVRSGHLKSLLPRQVAEADSLVEKLIIDYVKKNKGKNKSCR
jgi:hypothetical protein